LAFRVHAVCTDDEGSAVLAAMAVLAAVDGAITGCEVASGVDESLIEYDVT
jgi:hypothetical protein